ncbi:hypothetical protein [Methylobacterium sp. sgz302541]|uniref:hypothetical protein n=1 Tax=unclassified Methylobacterium TaxID=2615210 RepID=UPI003D358A52
MTSISSTNLSQLFAAQRPPPPSGGKTRVSDAIQSEAASGQISATDATALTSALDSIDSSLSADRASAQSSSSATPASSGSDSRLDPSKIKDRIDGLIADQVTSGTLTSAQADTLKQIFSAQGPGQQQGQQSGGDDQDGFGIDATGSGGGTGRVGHGHRGPPPGPPPSDDAADGSSSATSSASSDSGTDSVSDLLKSFIAQVQASQSSAAGYTGSGSSNAYGQQSSALLFDFKS